MQKGENQKSEDDKNSGIVASTIEIGRKVSSFPGEILSTSRNNIPGAIVIGGGFIASILGLIWAVGHWRYRQGVDDNLKQVQPEIDGLSARTEQNAQITASKDSSAVQHSTGIIIERLSGELRDEKTRNDRLEAENAELQRQITTNKMLGQKSKENGCATSSHGDFPVSLDDKKYPNSDSETEIIDADESTGRDIEPHGCDEDQDSKKDYVSLRL